MSHPFPPPSAFRDIHFPGQHDGERVLLVLRRHPVVFLATVFYFLLLGSLPVVFYLLLPAGFLAGPSGPLHGVTVLLLSAYYLFLWLFFTFAWVDYYLDLWIVTEERIVNIEQAGLFNRTISEQRLLRVQDVTSEVRGVLPTFLNYGRCYVQTAGERVRFIFEQIPHPDLVKKIVLRAHEDVLRRAGVSALPPVEATF